jgi:hypothetical protein
MAAHEESRGQAERRMRELAGGLAALRHHPCLLFVSSTIQGQDVVTLRKALGDQQGEHLDAIVASPGGDVGAAYLIARELRRRFARLTVYVPLQAKSAAILLCLAAEELVLGPLGELGPLDQQYDAKQQADFPLSTSRLVPFRALEQLQRVAADTYDELVGRILEKSGMRPFEACSKAAELTSSLYGPLFAQVDPTQIAECARGLELGMEYTLRLLRRYRPELEGKQGKKIVHALVHAYPSHGFIIDFEELAELGLPARSPREGETPLMDELAKALVEYGTAADLIELVPTAAAVPKMRRPLPARPRGELEAPERSKQGTRVDRPPPCSGLRTRARVRGARPA